VNCGLSRSGAAFGGIRLRLKVVCGQEGCRNEFSADTEEPRWTCPSCEHVIENPHFPFLTARIMQSKYKPEEVDYEAYFTHLVEDVRRHFLDREDFLFRSSRAEAARDSLGEKAMAFINMSMGEDEALVEEYRRRFEGDWRKMHESLLSEAKEIARKVWDLQHPDQ
jgi:hypothetical protein